MGRHVPLGPADQGYLGFTAGDWKMISQNILPLGAAIAVGVAALQGVETAHDVLTPPAIEGFGVYADPVSPGDEVLVDWTITKRVDCPGSTSRVWFGEGGFQLTEKVQRTVLPVSKDRHYAIPTMIPTLAPHGKLDLYIDGEMKCPDEEAEHFKIGPVTFEVTNG